ncbi:MAG TPA: hypothetical protein P5228_10860 [Bacteroidales bacterium]|nr:hypothetical protein [Bacteroidales bacterium]HRZ48453.1 hypothetical protein [Bacteroidales bacterium]
MEKEFTVGTRIDHEKYGEGVIIGAGVSTYDVLFERGGKLQFNKNRFQATVIGEVAEEATDAAQPISVKMLLEAVEAVLDRSGALQETVPLGERWLGGTMILQPANKDLKAKEIPIEVFFHKIVMLRDRLRVLEQNINSHQKLTDEDKVNMQQYITRIYGSLTSFNILFGEKDQYFTGTGG